MKRRIHSKSLVRSAPITWAAKGFTPLFFVFLALFSLVFSSYAPGYFTDIRSRVSDAVVPALNVITAPVQDSIAIIRDLSGLAQMQAENAKLRQENLRLQQWYQTAMALNVENESLKTLLNVQSDPEYQSITGRVVVDHDFAFFKSVMLNVGSASGVKKGLPVISGEGIVGRVIDAGEYAARVLLITDMNSRVPAYLDQSKHHTILAGQNTERLTIEHLPAGVSAQEGEYVLTSGKGGAYPLGLPIGEVRYDESGKAYVHPFAAFERMIHVRVLNTAEDPNLRRAGQPLP